EGVCIFDQCRARSGGAGDQGIYSLWIQAGAPSRTQCCVMTQTQMTVAAPIDIETIPLQQDGQVRRLLHLDEKDPLANGMWKAGRDEERVPWRYLPAVQ